MSRVKKKEAEGSEKLSKRTRRMILITVWIIAFIPLFAILFMLEQAKPGIPSHQELASPPDKQASIIYTSDGSGNGTLLECQPKKC